MSKESVDEYIGDILSQIINAKRYQISVACESGNITFPSKFVPYCDTPIHTEVDDNFCSCKKLF